MIKYFKINLVKVKKKKKIGVIKLKSTVAPIGFIFLKLDNGKSY